jgi:hypothetical protein
VEVADCRGQKLEFLYNGVRGEGTVIELKEGVCYCFRLFYGLVHELVRGAWLRFVRSIKENRPLLGNASDLLDLMFGSGRVSLGSTDLSLSNTSAGVASTARSR